MTDRPNSPIRIPIHFVDGDEPAAAADATSAEDDVIEIDGDSVDLEESESELAAAEAMLVDTEDAGEESLEGVIEPLEPEIAPRTDGGDAATGVAPEMADSPAPQLSVEAFASLSQELRQRTEAAERLFAEKNDLYDKLLRKQAEFENFRKRSEREMQETYGRARADVVGALLPVLDNFERAMQHENVDPTVLREGVQLIYKQLSDVLGRLGLTPVEAIGKPFDPEIHEAVTTAVDSELDDQTVLEEFQRGYKLGDRLLRPAIVKVSTQG